MTKHQTHPSGRSRTTIPEPTRRALIVPQNGTLDTRAAGLAFRDAKARQVLDSGSAYICPARARRLRHRETTAADLDHLVDNALEPTRNAIARHKERQA
ncbi:hypothetical protein KUW09_04725 [Mameliella alba]|nr:hypothetical protein [Antarctobacter heliothermus]MBY6143332.1 hypothetical protein [Mameliella alba]MBY6163995.1 hypothetical protein [Mameliella alba]MBY6172467.1 hypothetical protein [Mameliella alba]MBY6177481.1 hypothetical protein [Mameliella alba]